ncbi:hypothetical protein WCQ02_05965 [Paraburkholderia tropica]|uniref:hypothetical protein n=1 Tax=Paraburkholderia tropica TaxID=92647 RepID=UPI00301A8066
MRAAVAWASRSGAKPAERRISIAAPRAAKAPIVKTSRGARASSATKVMKAGAKGAIKTRYGRMSSRSNDEAGEMQADRAYESLSAQGEPFARHIGVVLSAPR